MRRLVLAVAATTTFAALATAEVKLSAKSLMEDGWMPGGWGNYEFTLENASKTPAKLVKWRAHWEVKGERIDGEWGGDEPIEVPAEGVKKCRHSGYLPEDLYRRAKPDPCYVVGTVTVEQGGEQKNLDFRFPVKGAFLPEPLHVVKGPYVSYALMESRFKSFKSKDAMLRWMNQAYSAMHELTGNVAENGEHILIKEAPRHPWCAYAGQTIIQNTDYVDDIISDAECGIVPFGWVHEIGHIFDVEETKQWYFWGCGTGEMQANFKLCYAIEQMDDRSIRMNFGRYANGTYPPRAKEFEPVDPRQFIDAFFTYFGDRYLADPTRTWESMNGDETHSFLQRIQRAYGWAPFKAWYRTFRRFHEAGLKPPKDDAEKVRITCAILSHETGVDLVPVFQLWRYPVTHEDVERIMETYPIASDKTEYTLAQER